MAKLTINGETRQVEVSDDVPLLWALRDILGMTGAKFGCGIAQCGACTVHVDGRPVRSCVLRVGAIGSREVTTIEGIGRQPNEAKIQKAWLEMEVIQCGYCQSGQIMAAAALLNDMAHPEDSDIDAALAGKYLPVWDVRTHSRSDQARCGGGVSHACRRSRIRHCHRHQPARPTQPRRRRGYGGWLSRTVCRPKPSGGDGAGPERFYQH